jgi:hypothetical protein
MTSTRLPLLGLTALLFAPDPSFAQPQPPPPPPIGVVRRAEYRQQTPEPPVDQATADHRALDAASLKAEDPQGLLDYLRQRTLSDADLSKIQAVIRRLGAEEFEERQKASIEVERFGPAAVGPLRTAAHSDPDYEVAYRAAECLRRMEKVPHAAVASAAVRALAKAKPPDTAKVLLAFLPLADNQSVADEIRAALKTVAVRDGKADPALVAALKDNLPERRAAAAVALIEGGSPGERVRVPDAYPRVREAARGEADIEAKFQMLFSMLVTSREKEAVGPLIDLLPALPRGRLWQAEDYLLQLAGPAAPKATFGKSQESLAKAAEAWKKWWVKAATDADLERFAYAPRVTGKTLLVLMDLRFGSTGSVVELGPDLKERWKIAGLSGPMDAQFLPDGSIAIAEQTTNRVTIRDTTGRVLAVRTVGGNNRMQVHGNPQQVQVLDNGNLLVTCRNVVVEFKKDRDEILMTYVRTNFDITAAHRFPDGQTLLLLQNGPNHTVFIDEKGKEVTNRALRTGMPYYPAHIAGAGPDRVLVTELNQVVEYDLKKNEVVWKKPVNQPRSVQRLPNGNTLVVDAQANRLVEFAPDGEEVWSHQPAGGMQVFRAYRR